MWTITDYKEIYSRYEASGLTVSQFCSNEQITHSRFYYWLRKYNRLPKPDISILNNPSDEISRKCGAGFIPVLLASGDTGKSYPLKADREKERVSAPVEPCSFMEINYQNGTTVRLRGEKDMELIKTLILLSR